MGSYASFLWSADEADDEEEETSEVNLNSSATLIPAC